MNDNKTSVVIEMYSAPGQNGDKYWGNTEALIEGERVEVTVWGASLKSLQSKVSSATGMVHVVREKKRNKGYSVMGPTNVLLSEPSVLLALTARNKSQRRVSASASDTGTAQPPDHLGWSVVPGTDKGSAPTWAHLLDISREVQEKIGMRLPFGEESLIDLPVAMSVFDDVANLARNLQPDTQVHHLAFNAKHGSAAMTAFAISIAIAKEIGWTLIVLPSDKSEEVFEMSNPSKKELMLLFIDVCEDDPKSFIDMCVQLEIVAAPINFAALANQQSVTSFL